MTLPGGLPTAGVRLETQQLDQFKAQMREANEAVRGMGKNATQYAKQAEFSLKDLTRAGGILTGILVGVAAAGRDLINTFYDGAQAAGELSRALQITAQEASRVLEVTDDFGVSGEQLRSSLRFALNQGVVPTIGGLADLSDEYLRITNDQERARWAQQRLGKQWMDFTRLLEAGGTAIRRAGADVSESLIFDSADVRRAEDYRVAVDKLGDAWRALKAAAGRGIIPEAAEWLQDIAMLAEGGNVLDYIRLRFEHTFHETDQTMQDWVNNVQWHAGEVDAELSRLAPTAAELWLTLNEGRNAGANAAAGLQQAVGPSQALRDALAGANTSLADVIDQFRTNMAWITGGGAGLEAAAQSVMNALLGGRITQEQADEMLRPIEAAALGLQIDIGQITMSDAQRTMIDDWGAEWGTARTRIQGAHTDIQNIPAEVQSTIRVAVQWYIQGGQRGLGEGLQHGGTGVVPPGFPGDSFPMFLTSGEHYVVSPPSVFGGQSVSNVYHNERSVSVGSMGGGAGPDMSNPYTRDRVMRGWLGG